MTEGQNSTTPAILMSGTTTTTRTESATTQKMITVFLKSRTKKHPSRGTPSPPKLTLTNKIRLRTSLK